MNTFQIISLHVPRNGHRREEAYLDTWRNLLGGAEITVDSTTAGSTNDFTDTLIPARRVLAIVNPFHDKPVDQRDITVATSFITWLGCGLGRGFLVSAMQLAERMGHNATDVTSYSDAYRAAWALHNAKPTSTGTLRARDTVLNFEYIGGECTLRDSDTMGAAAAWLGTDHGQEFIADAEMLAYTRSARRHDINRALADLLVPVLHRMPLP